MNENMELMKKEIVQGLEQYIDQTATNIVELAEIMKISPASLIDFLERAVQAKYHKGGKR